MAEEIRIRLTAEGNAKVEIGKVEKELKDLEAQAKDTGKSFSQAGEVFKGVFASQVVTSSLSALKNGLNRAFRSSQEFSKGIAEVNSILGENSQLVKDQTDSFIDFAAQFGTSSAEQAKTFYQIVSAGVTDAKEATDLLRVSNKAAVAGLTSTETAVRAIAATFNTYKTTGIEAAQVSDILFATVKSGITNFEALANNIGKVAPLAQSAGVSFDELSGTLAFLTKSGLSTEEAATGVRAVLTSLLKPTDAQRKAAQSLGIEFDATALKTKGLEGVLNDVRNATGGSTEAVAKLFPNVRALGPVLSIVNGNFQDFKNVLSDVADSTNATDSAFQRINVSAAQAEAQFDAAAEAVGTQLGNNLEEVTSLALQFGTTLLTSIRSSIPDTVTLAKTFASLVVVADTVQRAFSGVFAVIRQSLQSIVVSFTNAISTIVSGANSIASALPGVESPFKNLDETLKLVAQSSQDTFNQFTNDIEEASNGETALGNLATAALRVAEDAESGLGRFGEASKSAAADNTDAKDTIVSNTQEISDALKRQIQLGQDLAKASQQNSPGAIAKRDNEVLKAELEASLITQQEFFDRQNEIVNEQFLKELEAIQEANKAKAITNEEAEFAAVDAARRANEQRKKIDLARTKFEVQQAKQREQNTRSSLNSIATLQASSSKELFRIGQAASLATAIIDGIQAIQKALAVGPPLSFALVPAVTAAQAANVAKIASAKPPGLQGGIDSVPPGFDNDTFPALLSSGERVVPAQTNQDLTRFLDSQRSTDALLTQLINEVRDSGQVVVNVGGETITNVVRRELEAGNTLEVEA